MADATNNTESDEALRAKKAAETADADLRKAESQAEGQDEDRAEAKAEEAADRADRDQIDARRNERREADQKSKAAHVLRDDARGRGSDDTAIADAERERWARERDEKRNRANAPGPEALQTTRSRDADEERRTWAEERSSQHAGHVQQRERSASDAEQRGMHR